MDRSEFYAALRKSNAVFGRSLSEKQVAVMEAILDETLELPNAQVAYIMATAYHETGSPRMTPTVENLNYTSARRLMQVWPSRFKSEASAAPFVRNARKLANQVYNGRLGNRAGSDDGWTFRGRGLDHLTGRDNYTRAARVVGADIVANPDLMLEPKIAVRSLVHGMTTGRYRGHKLADYDTHGAGFDFQRARAIVNADVFQNGPVVAGHARAFLAALEVSGRRPVRGAVAPVRTPEAVTLPEYDPPSGGGWIAALVRLLLSLVRR